VCLNSGCIPTKTLLASAHLYHKMKKQAALFNIKVEGLTLDYLKLVERKDRLTVRLVKGIEKLMTDSQVTVITGEAVLTPGKKVIVNNETYTADSIILATGAIPADLPGFLTDGVRVFNSTQLLLRKELPQSISIIGGGVIGLEFADVLSCLGVAVTIYEVLPKILPFEDQEAVETVKKSLQQRGVTFVIGAPVSPVDELPGEIVLLAAGRKIPTEYIQDIGITKGSKGEVLISETMETAVPGVYAIGDLNNKALYAHAASFQGIAVIDNILHKSTHAIDLTKVPKVIFTGPQIASIGRTDGENQEIKKIAMLMLGKAQAENQTEGFLKLFVHKDTKVIEGVVLVAESADALIGEAVVLVNKKVTLPELAQMMHPHPTFSEIYTEVLK
jgi:dihydrolipoamide dehydrogenase